MRSSEITPGPGDVREIENLMSAQFYLSYANRRKELLDNYWSARDDIAYGMEDRACIGHDAVYQYYVDAYGEAQAARSGGAGDMTLDLSTSPYIEVAQDGQTAQGIVITMSYRADAGVTDHIRSRFGFDFVKENGVWRSGIFVNLRTFHFPAHLPILRRLGHRMTSLPIRLATGLSLRSAVIISPPLRSCPMTYPRPMPAGRMMR